MSTSITAHRSHATPLPLSQQLGYRPKTPLQKLIVALSSLLYLIPAYFFWVTPGIFNELGALVFVLVSFFSALADGSLLEEPFFAPGIMAPYAEPIDRWTATLGGAYAVLMWLTRPMPAPYISALEVLLGITATLPLHFARTTPFKGQDVTWRWVILQSIWHMYSAFVVSVISPHPPHGGTDILGWSS